MRVKERCATASMMAASTTTAHLAMRPKPMPRQMTLDVRGMEPPEPLERVLSTIDDFAEGDRLTVLIDCHPVPLFRILDRDGYAYTTHPGAESLYEIAIWRR